MTKRSQAYREGFYSKKNENPYKIGTDEYNEFERGWTQKLKRNFFVGFSGVTTCPEPKVVVREKVRISKYSSYADAKGK